MASPTSRTGSIGEQIAADFLERAGYEILEMNYKNEWGRRLGEIDIIARDRKEKILVFVEVKTRDFFKYGETLPEENITRSKLRKLNKIANAYLLSKNLRSVDHRFDAVSVWLDLGSKNAKIKHIRCMFL